jgi:flagellar biosynthesis chaperone FliJ
MSNERIGRLTRIVDLRQRSLNEARAGLADASRKAGEVGKARALAEAAVVKQRDELAGRQTLEVGDLAAGHAYVQTLRVNADTLANAAAAAEAAAMVARKTVRHAHVELRKIERWQEMLSENEAQASRKLERAVNDEFAARRAPR